MAKGEYKGRNAFGGGAGRPVCTRVAVLLT